ncbi:AfsR/SARP family transcriptional regulator [Actinoplanes utahensis]|uniref:AfsR/SARP family transcriptional regulator n=1 Tax=Actinoplanes utahensis TaxID=1869 RepID=UPI00137855D8|nr:transcriptional regulator [Actinoplanes utahensis]
MLGPLDVRRGTAAIRMSAGKPRIVLAYLITHAGRTVTVDDLTTELWAGSPPPSAVANIRTYIAGLRRSLGSTLAAIVVHPNGYRLQLADDCRLDLDEFRALVGRGRADAAGGQPHTAIGHLDRALGIWRGSALEGLRDGPVLSTFAAVLEEERVQAVEEAVDARLRARRFAEAVPMLRRHLEENPLREHAYAQLMTALYHSGDVSGALAAFGAAREQLSTHLGIEPGRALSGLHLAILDRSPVLDAEPRETSRITATETLVTPFLTPPAVAGFTGRDTETGYAVRALTATPRDALPIVAVSGLAGSGKTALAVTVAHRVRAAYPDGQLYADLHGDSPDPATPGEVIGQFLTALGVPAARFPDGLSDRTGMLRSALAGRRILIVLDNAADAAQVRPLLPGAADCGVLVTGRSRLCALDGARFIALAGLPEPAAVALFTEVLGRPAGAEEAAVRAIVRSCDRLPLAVRIAAVRAAGRPGRPLALLAALLADETTRLDTLRAGDLDVRARLTGAYRSLQAPDRRLLRLLSLQPGPDVAAGVTDRLDALVDAGFLTETGPQRYRVHGLVRALARESADGSSISRTAMPSTRSAGK